MSRLFILLFVLIGINSSFACNICGGGSGSSFMGILPQFNKHFLGLRYSFKNFNVNEGDSFKKESFQSYDLWGRWYPSEKVQLLYFVPYNVNYIQTNSKDEVVSGLGDISLIGNYQLVNKTADSLLIKQMLLIGGGVKLPTGKFMQRDDDKLMYNPAYQVGTGAYALSANLIYTVRKNKVGMNNELSFKYHFENELKSQIGSQYSSAHTFFVWKKINSKTICIPQIGTYIEAFSKNKLYKNIEENTGGNNVFGTFGIDFYFNNKVIFNTTGMLPIVYDESSSVDKTNPTIRAQFSLNFLL